MDRRYGNTLADVWRTAWIGGVLALTSFVLFAITSASVGGILDTGTWLKLVIISIGVGSVLPAIALITCAFSVRVEGGVIRHLFLGRFVLSEHNLSDITRVRRWTGIHPIVVQFRDGSRIRFIGARLSRLREMETELNDAIPRRSAD